MNIIKQIEMKIKQERLYQEDYALAMEREHKRLDKERREQEEQFEEFMADYKRDRAKFGF